MISYLKDIIFASPTNLITYADYINAVLYHPELGYYMKNKQKIGREGDFITSSNISDIFGRTFAKWFAYCLQKNNLPPVFCEIGAGNGRFAKAFLEEWQESIKIPVTYIIVESSPYHRKLQRELLSNDFPYTQADTLDELDSFEGMIFSNELFDALPVHVIEKRNGQLYEVMIGIKNNELTETTLPLTNPAIIHFLQENKLELIDNQRIEIPLAMGSMLEQFSRRLKRGIVTTIDYGYSQEEWMEPSRRKGSLRGYYQHKMIDNVLLYPGEMDITTHIHFDWLMKRGEQEGLNFIMKLRQDEFLVNSGILQDLQNNFDPNPFSEVSKRNRAIRSLIMGMGTAFHVMIQEKGMEKEKIDLFSK